MATDLLGFAAAGSSLRPGEFIRCGVSAVAVFAGKKELAYASLLRSRSPEQADTELREMEQTASAVETRKTASGGAKDTLLRRKYVIPFILACVILFCNTATGVNSIIGITPAFSCRAGFLTCTRIGAMSSSLSSISFSPSLA